MTAGQMVYRVIGTTDDVTTCQLCGRPNLKKTVILRILDEEGNEEEQVYYGTACAAMVTGRKQTSIKNEAATRDHERAERAAWARDILAVYGPVEGNVRATADLFYGRNPHMRCKGYKATELVGEMLTNARAALA